MTHKNEGVVPGAGKSNVALNRKSSTPSNRMLGFPFGPPDALYVGRNPAVACVRLNPPDPRSFHCETVAPTRTARAASQPATIFVAAMTSGTLAGTMTSGEVGLNEPQQSQLISYSNTTLKIEQTT